MKLNVRKIAIMTFVTVAAFALSTGLAATSMTPGLCRTKTAFAAAADHPQPTGASIVGMWKFKLVAQDSPPVLDGTIVDVGFSVWHSDGTEIMNSSRPPATGNVWLGVWTKTGPSTYKLNQQGLSFDSAGNLLGPVTIREEVTVDHGGDSFSGTFSIDFFDNLGQGTGHVAGRVTAERITVD